MGNEDSDADARAIAGKPQPSTRVPLDRERILAAALSYIEEHGLPQLSMRKLGAELGVEGMSLYRYVPGREALLDESSSRSLMRCTSTMTCSRRLTRVAGFPAAPGPRSPDVSPCRIHGPFRSSRPAHPGAMAASPLRSLRWVESFLDGLTTEGFSDKAAVAAYRGFTSFLLGHLLLEVSTLGADVGPLDVLDEEAGPLHGASVADFPS